MINDRTAARAAKQKGRLAEAQVVDCLREHGFPYAERRALAGTHDRGDVTGIPGVVMEIKNCARLELAVWMDEALREADGKDPDLALVVHKRKGKGDPLDWYVTCTLRDMIELLMDFTKAIDFTAAVENLAGSFKVSGPSREMIEEWRQKGLIGRG